MYVLTQHERGIVNYIYTCECFVTTEQSDTGGNERTIKNTCQKELPSTTSSEGKKLREAPMFKRRKGESVKDYLERVDVEANTHIMETYRKSRRINEKRRR